MLNISWVRKAAVVPQGFAEISEISACWWAMLTVAEASDSEFPVHIN